MPEFGMLRGKKISLVDADNLPEADRAEVEVTLEDGSIVRPFRFDGDGSESHVDDSGMLVIL